MGAPLLLNGVMDLSRTYPNLASISRPAANAGNQPEAQPWVLFDTQLYPTAGVSKLSFFQSATAANASDVTLSNFPTGLLQAMYFFELHRMHLWIHSMPAFSSATTVSVAGPANDVEVLHKTARGTMVASLNSRPYLPFPIWYFGRPGGPNPGYSTFGTGTVADNVVSYGETEANGGFPVLGNIVIPPMVNWSTDLLFNKTAISADTYITVSMMGVLHRPLG